MNYSTILVNLVTKSGQKWSFLGQKWSISGKTVKNTAFRWVNRLHLTQRSVKLSILVPQLVKQSIRLTGATWTRDPALGASWHGLKLFKTVVLLTIEVYKTVVLLKQWFYQNCCFTKTVVLLKQLFYQNCCFTKTDVLLKLMFYQNWCFTKTDVLLKQMFYQNSCFTKTAVLPKQQFY